jgi:DUF1365 family protein
MHARFAPKAHRFDYRIFLFALDLDELDALHAKLRLFSRNRRNLYSYRDGDFLPTHESVHNGRARPPAVAKAMAGPKSTAWPAKPWRSRLGAPDGLAAGPAVPPYQDLKQRVVAHLAAGGIDLTGGRVLLVTLPRVLGYLFNPVSFYFCYDRTGAPVAALAEVTNTFKEMKPYRLGPETREQRTEDRGLKTEDGGTGGLRSASPGQSSVLSPLSSEVARRPTFRLRVPKHFYVSPFSDVDVAFDFTLRAPGDRLSVQIDDYVGANRMLTSTLTGPRQPLTDARLAWFTLKYPLLTLRIIGLIHWHAFRLWLKNVPWFAKAARGADQRDLYRPHGSLTAAPAPLTSTSLAPSSKT